MRDFTAFNSRKSKNIIFAIIPKGNWVFLLIALVIILASEEFLTLSTAIFNILLFLLGLKFAVLLHEIGHLLFAKLMGGVPKRLILGKGHKVAQGKFRGIRIILHNNFNSGLAYAAFDNLKFIRVKLLLFSAGGFLTNFFIAALLIPFFEFPTSIIESIKLPSIIIVSNLVVGVSVLIPYRITYQGSSLNSDGLSILKIPFYKESQLVELSSMNELLDAYDLLESKNYEGAIAIYENYQSKVIGSKTVNINLAVAYMKLGNYKKAIELLTELLDVIEEEPFKRFKNYIYNGLAWKSLLLNQLDDADKYSKLAYKLDSDTVAIRGTRASVLIEMGLFEKGKELLIYDVDFGFPNNNTLSASMYLGLAFHKKGESKKAGKYIKFVDENLEFLDLDERTLYNRIKQKMRA